MRPDVRAGNAMLSVERALDVLEAFSTESSELGLVDISRALDLPKSSVFRYLAVLERRGYLQRKSDGQYCLGLKLLGMSNLVRAHLRVVDVALPLMQELRSQHSETVNLAMLEHGEVVHIEVLEGLYGIKMTSPIGSRAAAHSTSLGKAMLAFSDRGILDDVLELHGLRSLTDRTLTSKSALLKDLDEVRQRGYAIDDGESEQGLYCVGAPIFDSRAEVTAAISISGPSLRMLKRVGDLARDVARSAAEISSRLGSTEHATSRIGS